MAILASVQASFISRIEFKQSGSTRNLIISSIRDTCVSVLRLPLDVSLINASGIDMVGCGHEHGLGAACSLMVRGSRVAPMLGTVYVPEDLSLESAISEMVQDIREETKEQIAAHSLSHSQTVLEPEDALYSLDADRVVHCWAIDGDGAHAVSSYQLPQPTCLSSSSTSSLPETHKKADTGNTGMIVVEATVKEYCPAFAFVVDGAGGRRHLLVAHSTSITLLEIHNSTSMSLLSEGPGVISHMHLVQNIPVQSQRYVTGGSLAVSLTR